MTHLGRDGLLIEGYSASHWAQKCHLPPWPHAGPSPRASHHRSWLPMLGWTLSPMGHVIRPSTSSVLAGGEGEGACPCPLWAGGGSSAYCKAHVAAGMCCHAQPKLEVSLGLVPRHIVWLQPGQGVPRALQLPAWLFGEPPWGCCEKHNPFPPHESQHSMQAAGGAEPAPAASLL